MSPKLDPPRLWITRTHPQAEATAARLRDLGWTPVVAPVLQIRRLDEARTDLSDADDLAFTSQAAVMAYAGLIARRDSRVFAIGSATAHAAREAGFTAVDTPTDDEWGDVAALAERIARASPRPAMVMNPTAREPAADLAEMLVRRGVGARSVAVYETIKATLTAPPDNLFGILVHSPKAARAVAGLVDRDLAQRLCVWSISEAAAAPLRGLGFGRIVLADRPNEQALLEKLRQ